MAEKKKRARNKKGHYIKDDPSTPDINEAYEKPKKKAKKTVKKPKNTKKTPKVVQQKPPYGVAGVVLALLLIALYFLSN
tara:strand:- start:5633 stop:5869 length:237 start_codon:yes stop_codon:yes gene_type:complete